MVLEKQSPAKADLERMVQRLTRRRALRVRVDRNLCIGVGNCVGLAPTVFKLDDENKAVILDPSSVDDKTLLDAAESCPEQAIIVEDDDGRQLYP